MNAFQSLRRGLWAAIAAAALLSAGCANVSVGSPPGARSTFVPDEAACC